MKKIFLYSNKNKIVEIQNYKYFDNDEKLMSKRVYNYDQNNNMKLETTFNSNGDTENDMPFIELVAKILAPGKPSTVVLRVNDHTLHLTEGSTVSQLVNRKIVNIRVDKISETYVTIFLSPFEKVMVLQ